jgi:hypothetical protein
VRRMHRSHREQARDQNRLLNPLRKGSA